jgi:predicted short-subunit dehydrogenase-like oxidoreductase (DUF2520 family)
MKIVVIGTGRVAFHLGHAFRRAGMDVPAVVGRNAGKAASLANELDCASLGLNDPLPVADATILAVSDSAIADVARGLDTGSSVLIHTSGAGSLDLLAPHAHRAALWPIMTLSPGTPMDFAGIPLVIDANTAEARHVVRALATAISKQVVDLPHAKREVLHAAAAISTNLPLFLLSRAEGLLKAEAIDPSLLMPSFQAMAVKAATIGAMDALTGPARRGDIVTLRHHIARLTSDPDLRRVYVQLSRMILAAHGHSTDELNDL